MVTKEWKIKSYAEILIGFNYTFCGYDLYERCYVSSFMEVQAFKDMLVNFGHNPILGILMGFALTVGSKLKCINKVYF